MNRLATVAVAAALVWSASAALGFAQGVQTGSIRGTVRDQQDLPMPGVTVTATSDALQGPRTTVTDSSGLFSIAALPAGDYEIKWELSGFMDVTKTTALPLGLTVEQSVVMSPAGVAEGVTVVAEKPAPIATPVVGSNFKHEEIQTLANPRTIQGIAQLSAGVNENSPNLNQIVINGAFAFDNAFMINGVDINDNVFAQPQNLFIEDAIQETQVLTSGISAEYGRFTGGVINAITKSGGNSFTGSFRVNLSNPAWTAETPFDRANGVERTSDLQGSYESTFGGPILKDRLWFFSAGRLQQIDPQRTLPLTGTAFTQNEDNKRGEIKGTGTVAQGQTIQVGYLKNSRATTNDSGVLALVVDPRSLVTRERPSQYFTTSYHGVLGQRLLAEAQYTERRSQFLGGGTSTSLVDSPFVDTTHVPPGAPAAIYSAPIFDQGDPDERNNRQFTINATTFWNRLGRHETKSGYEFYRSQIVGGNSQSSTGYVFYSDFAIDANGTPLHDSAGRLIPLFVPGSSFVESFPGLVRGISMNNDSHSLFVQDHWAINRHWSADLGARFEHVRTVSTGDILGVEGNRIVPRLAAAYDFTGNGSRVMHVTYGQYSGRYNDAQIAGNSPVGNPPFVDAIYRGPAGAGLSFAPGLDVNNYPISSANAFASIPTANVFIDSDLKSALVHEFTASFGSNLTGRGFGEATYVYRKTTSLVEDFFTIADGSTHIFLEGVDAGVFSNKVFRNTADANRQYQGLVFQSRYRISPAWTVNGHYTVQLENDGNYEGEATQRPGATSFIGDYPEAFNATRNFPDGRLQSFQRHRVRLWTIHEWGTKRSGTVSVSGLWRIDSGRVYSLAALNQRLTATQRSILAAAGYPDLPARTGNSIYFAKRGTESFKGYGLLDTSVNYSIPVFRSLRPWIKFDVFNLFDNEKLISWNTTIQPNAASPSDNLGLATDYVKGPAFGQMESNANFPGPFNGFNGGRTIVVAMGVQF